VVYETATPRTYERFTRRPRGAVGGVRLTLANSNQHAVPHDIGVPGFWLAGDTTWPGLGTVACVLGSRLVAEGILASLPPMRGACRRAVTAGPVESSQPEPAGQRGGGG
jgi:phytoene dehydrogenase-like protein